MKIVIDIDEEVYKSFMDDYVRCPDIIYAVRKGTPLPKGHGRLKDIDAFIAKVQIDRQHAAYTRSWTADDVLDALNKSYAPTIIEADKEEQG